jgi:8-oxo-dGTP pyrophosphatase MutT (NUDIX family)
VQAQDEGELFDLYTREGAPLGIAKPRGLVHRDGDWHRSVHIWVWGVLDGAPHLVFQRRSPGKDTYPGALDVAVTGHARAGEPLEATLREAEEEIGLPPAAVRVLGALQPTPTIATGYAIYPFVGLIEPGMAWTLSAREVAEVLELALDDLRAGYGRRRLKRRGLPIRTDTYVVGDDLIWGATARILADLFERLGALQAQRAY